MRKVYMDNAATTAVKPEALKEMLPYFCETCGNAHSIHSFGRDAEKGMEKARAQVARAIGAQDREIFFNLRRHGKRGIGALRGVVSASRRGKHIITSQIEHLMRCCTPARSGAEKEGYEVTYLPVDAIRHGAA